MPPDDLNVPIESMAQLMPRLRAGGVLWIEYRMNSGQIAACWIEHSGKQTMARGFQWVALSRRNALHICSDSTDAHGVRRSSATLRPALPRRRASRRSSSSASG
jgi:hypothetical protein